MNLRILFIVIIIVACGAGSIFLATRTIPAPRHAVEKVLSNDQFFK